MALIFLTLFILHIPLLRLPYFWDEAGYYIPAARDLWLTGSLIPHSTPSNAHPPLVLAFLALAWKLAGYAPVVTRTCMLVIATLALTGLFRLAQRVANTHVGIASAVCVAVYPVFFVQSSLAHLDMAAAACTFWGLLAYVEKKPLATAIWFSLGVLSKETAILAPVALLLYELARSFRDAVPSHRFHIRVALVFPIFPLVAWYTYHWMRTGFIFGNPEFLRYNVQDTVHSLRILLALALRLWQVLGYLGLYGLSLLAIFCMRLRPQNDNGVERRRIALEVQFSFLAVILAYVVAMAVIGGAELARYMLPAVPLVIIIFLSTLRRRFRYWRTAVAVVTLTFAESLFVNPSYGFSFEDNLAYRDYILLHQKVETYIEAAFPMARVLTAWPGNDELSRPYLGYVTRPMRVYRIDDFTNAQLSTALTQRSKFDAALVFSTKYEPAHPWLENWTQWQRWKTEYFGYHRDVTPPEAAVILGGSIVYEEYRNRQWAAIIALPQASAAPTQNKRREP